jgi:hypothetical protein
MKRRATVFILGTALIASSVAGCVRRGTLRMHVSTPHASFSADEPIRLDVRLAAEGGRVNLARTHWFKVELRPLNVREQLLTGSERGAWCRDNLMMFFPYLYPLWIMDVGDVFGKVKLLTPWAGVEESIVLVRGGRSRRRHGERLIAVHPQPADQTDADPAQGPVHSLMLEPWPPGEYEITISLMNIDLGLWPAPPLYRPDESPVSSSVRVNILGSERGQDEKSSTSRPDHPC